jgi:hypothetical protein
MASERKLFIKILILKCFVTEERGFDDIYLVLKSKKIWPQNQPFKPVMPGDTKIDVVIKGLDPNMQVDLEIWDFDYLSSNDLLGKVPLLIDEPGGPFTTDMIPNSTETDKAKYSILWEIDYEKRI